jgi:F-type H+-transporting ATPase subunit b
LPGGAPPGRCFSWQDPELAVATNTATHTEAPGGHKPAFPPFQKDTFASQIVWLVIAFVALYLLISRIAVPRIGGIFEERTRHIEGDLAAAQRLKAESEAALAAYEKSLAEARNRAQTIAGETRDRLHAQAEERRKALEAELNIKLAEAEKQIAATKTAAMANVRDIAVEAAAAIVERLIGAAPPAPAVAAAVDDALKR